MDLGWGDLEAVADTLMPIDDGPELFVWLDEVWAHRSMGGAAGDVGNDR